MASAPETETGSSIDTKRLVLGSNNPNVEHSASINRPMFSQDWEIISSSGYKISDHMINEPPPGKPFRIIMIGAGGQALTSCTTPYSNSSIRTIPSSSAMKRTMTWAGRGWRIDIPGVRAMYPVPVTNSAGGPTRTGRDIIALPKKFGSI
ncbi:hypothetical protein ACJ72_02122 [Emergomyces africanus]|uniref:Uncharacterized protein n=1 Tax=Emergomyces africanus TaxID=1955775 RepID=A0A1B7P3R4_9EURO|nr:hypothetical protein ACJ72_02122 [Emergomyces africanus]